MRVTSLRGRAVKRLMARNRTHIDVSPSQVWAVLEDPYAYPQWVVGTDRTTDADANWPAPGSAFRVHIAFGHIDSTKVKALIPGKRIVLLAAASFLGPARVTIELEPEGVGHASSPSSRTRPARSPRCASSRPMHLAIRLRNVESLRRFKRRRRGAIPARCRCPGWVVRPRVQRSSPARKGRAHHRRLERRRPLPPRRRSPRPAPTSRCSPAGRRASSAPPSAFAPTAARPSSSPPT